MLQHGISQHVFRGQEIALVRAQTQQAMQQAMEAAAAVQTAFGRPEHALGGVSAELARRFEELEAEVQDLKANSAGAGKVLSAHPHFKDMGKLGHKDVHYIEWTGGFLSSLDELRPGAMEILRSVRKLNDRELTDASQIELHGWSVPRLERFSAELYSLLLKSTTGEYNRVALSLQAGSALRSLAGLEAWRLIHFLAAPRNYQRAESINSHVLGLMAQR